MFNFNEEQELRHQQGAGIDIIFILDTSLSMEGEGLRQMKGVVSDILNGRFFQYYDHKRITHCHLN